jgi:methylmalonyl-CoA/ethylmalonyl-CoA epimerase
LDLKGLHHTGIVVRSLKETYAVYRDQLGMKLLVEEYIEDQGVRAALLDTGNSLLELLEPVEPETGIARYLEKRGEGMHHICLEVDGIQRALDEIKSQGLQLIDETPRPGLTGTIAFLHPSASHGVLIELVDSAGAYRAQR